MRLKIVTYYYSNNYGALLQSLYLKEFLEKNFEHEVSFSRYIPKKLFFREHYKPLLKKNLKLFLQNLNKFWKIKKWKKNIAGLEKPLSRYDDFDNDISLYGSDEIWNFTNPFFGFDPFFFGENNNTKKISYATSIGNADINKLTTENRKKIKYLLNTFASISVRDLATANFIEDLIGKKPEIVVDPTLLLNSEKINSSNIKIKTSNFAIVYGNYFLDEEKKMILQYCEKNHLNLVSIGYYNDWIKKNYINLNPDEFINYFKDANNVFTSMFHGVMFSVKYNKQFWYSSDPYRKNKLEYFINNLNLNSQSIKSSNNFKEMIDYKITNIKLKKWIELSKKYIFSII